MVHMLLLIIYVAFVGLGLPDGLLGAAWPSIYPSMGADVAWAGIVSCVISVGTVVSTGSEEGAVGTVVGSGWLSVPRNKASRTVIRSSSAASPTISQVCLFIFFMAYASRCSETDYAAAFRVMVSSMEPSSK